MSGKGTHTFGMNQGTVMCLTTYEDGTELVRLVRAPTFQVRTAEELLDKVDIELANTKSEI